MNKHDLLIAGMILAALPMSAQNVLEKPVRSNKDAKVIFTQDFEPTDDEITAEEAWDAWQAEIIDSIVGITYYVKPKITGGDGSGNGMVSNIYAEDNLADYQVYGVRDTILRMQNGVMPTDGKDKEGNPVTYYDADDYKIVNNTDPERVKAFDLYGQDGGEYTFSYKSGKCSAASSQFGEYYNGVTSNYRRNLFIRGLDIEENTSYRLTYYVKANAKGAAKPTMYAEVMRGYFTSEKPFTMGYVANSSDSHPYEWNSEFSLKKEEFTGDWEKVTLMTHYLNDSIAEAYMYANGYWWAEEWAWTPEGQEETYHYIQQPDKFFARFSFSSDSTDFEIDNISLTKSNIGGVEYYGDMLRVDFGFETNLAELAKNAVNGENTVAAIELPADFYSVYALSNVDHEWYKIGIYSAEYHDDGYMYIWTLPIVFDNVEYVNELGKFYDSVLVSFTNPVNDPKMCLKYSGAKFPRALDVDWIKDGKKVDNFYNEVAIPNPNIEYNQFNKKVYSMKNLPPALQVPEYEMGSFNLDGSIRTISFKFSRPVLYDNKGKTSDQAMLQVFNGGAEPEYWMVKGATAAQKADSTLVFERPASATAPLNGDIVFKLVSLQGHGTDFADPISFNYSFGTSDIAPTFSHKIDFNSATASADFVKGDKGSISDESFNGNFTTTSTSAAKISPFSGLYDGGLMFGLYGVTGLSNGGSTTNYNFTITEGATYEITTATSGCQKGSWNDACKMVITIYDEQGNALASCEEGSSDNKPEEGGEVTAVDKNSVSALLSPGKYRLEFSLPNENSYGGGHKGGRVLYEISFSKTLLGWGYISNYRQALDGLNSRIQFAGENKDKYTGEKYEEVCAIAAATPNFVAENSKPSVFNDRTQELNNATAQLNARIALVDAMYKENNLAVDTLAFLEDYEEAATYIALNEIYEAVDALIPNEMSDDEIKAQTQEITDAIKALADRVALIEKFDNQVAATEAVIAEAKFAENNTFAEMQEAFNANKGIAKVTCTDDQLTAATKAIFDATLAHESYVAGIESSTKGVLALIALAEKLEVEIDDENVKARVEELVSDDQGLASIYKSAIKIALYKKLADQDVPATGYDLTGFIRNFNLYSAANVDVDLEKYYYQWGTPNDRWKMKNGYTSENTFPGWVAKAAGGNVHTGNETVNWSVAKAPIFDSYIGADWSSTVTISQEVELPVGLYNLGVAMNFSDDAGEEKASMKAIAPDSTYVVLATVKKSDPQAAANTFIDSIAVANTITIEANVTSSNSWTWIDNFELKMIGKDKTFDYAAAAKAEEVVLAELITFVDAAVAQGAKVTYYTLAGVQIDAPQAGSMTIVVSEFANGQRKVEKILVK